MIRHKVILLGGALLAGACLSGCTNDSSATPDPASSEGSESTHISPQEQLARDFGLEDLPDVDVIREITPDESVQAQAECMTEAGWAPEQSNGSEGAEYVFSSEQEEAYNLAFVTCRMQYPIEQRFLEPLNEAQYEIIYDHMVSETIPCLEGLGYTIEEPPSRDVYISSIESDNPYIVNEAIYHDVEDDVRDGRWSSVQEVFSKVCPLDPPDEDLYGS